MNFKSKESIRIASYIITMLVLTGVLLNGLLPGLLSLCVGYLISEWIANKGKRLKINATIASTILIVMPMVVMVLLIANAKGMMIGMVSQYKMLLTHLANTVLEIMKKLPSDVVSSFPDEVQTIQVMITTYLKSQVKEIAGLGKLWMHGMLITYVGLVIGALISGTERSSGEAPLRQEIRGRGKAFVETFKQIVVAQFWIASVNTICTAIFLLIVMPMFGVKMPYVMSLLIFTFMAGMIPIVGNLVCNGVMTIAGISVSSTVGVSCLIFLVVIHKFEYVINAKLLGKQTKTSAWELLSVMFVGEAIFGVTGLVAGPLYYTYWKKELQSARLV